MLKVVSSAASSVQKLDVSDIFDDNIDGETVQSYEDKKTDLKEESSRQSRKNNSNKEEEKEVESENSK